MPNNSVVEGLTFKPREGGDQTRGKMASRTASLLLLAVLLPLALAEHQVRGLDPRKKAHYHPGRDFTCLDGSDTISFSMVNDDYCDCADGSDEPGTAACPLGQFYCINKGHKPTITPSSRVNDGICDCCDGSDEWWGEVNCPNTCQELGKKEQEEQRKREEMEAQGYQKRVQYEQQGIRTREDKLERLQELKSEQEKLQGEVEGLKKEKEGAEEPERLAKEEHEKKWEEEKAARKEAERVVEARAGFDQLDTDSNGVVSLAEIQARQELDDDGDGEVSQEEALAYLDNEVEVDFDQFLERVWSFISDKCNFEPPPTETEPEAPPPEPTPPTTEEKEPGGEEEEEDFDDYDDYDDMDEDEGDVPAKKSTDDMPPYPEETQTLIEAADKAREALRQAESQKRDVDREVGDLDKYINTDMGEAMEFAPLYDNCYEYTDREYTYKMCAFNKVTQRPKSGGRETSLGTWVSWNGPKANPYSSMLFENGEGCWNGPKRSTKVSVSCGLEEELLSASEPNRCEYAMEFVSPAACHLPSTDAPSAATRGHQEL